MRRFILLEQLGPGLVGFLALRQRGPPVVERGLRLGEINIRIEAVELLRLARGILAERFAVHVLGARFWRPVTNDGADTDERRLALLFLRDVDGLLDLVQVVAVVDELHMPVIGSKAQVDILGVAQLRGAVE